MSMIKTNNTTVEVPETVVAEGVSLVLAETGNRELRDLNHSKHRYESNVQRTQRGVTARRNDINEYHREILRLKEQEKEEKRRLLSVTKQLEAVDTTETMQKAEANITNAKKLKYVESIELDGSNIIIQTRLIFTAIRTESGSRETERRCVGAYKIVLNFSDHRVRITNELFTEPRGHDHWAIRRSEPCQGEHNERFTEAFNNGDLFMLLETCFHFIRSTDDNGAYEPSDSWLYNRNERMGRANPSVRKDNYVFVHGDYDQYNAEEHCNYAKIVRCDHGNLYLEFKEAFTFGHNMRGLVPEGKGYRVALTNVRKISKKEFDEESLTLEGVRNANPLQEIDALPDGSSLQDAKDKF